MKKIEQLHIEMLLQQGKFHNYTQKGRYLLFLKSEYWREVSKMVKARDLYICKSNNHYLPVSAYLEVHHYTYENHLYEHLYLDDLVTLCEDCHKLEDKPRKRKPIKSKFPAYEFKKGKYYYKGREIKKLRNKF